MWEASTKVLQKSDYAVGNFINCTPAIQIMAEQTGKPVKVKFQSYHVEQLFEKCDFIESVDDLGSFYLHSGLINRDIPDYKYFWQCAKRHYNLKDATLPHTYIDDPKEDEIDNLIVMARGCANPNKWNTKDPGNQIYMLMIDKLLDFGFDIMFVGSEADREHNSKVLNNYPVKQCYGDIQLAVKAISSASSVIMNDTGLYHAAGALKKLGLIMWKKTNMVKNQSPNKNFIHSTNQNYYNDFKYLLEKYDIHLRQ